MVTSLASAMLNLASRESMWLLWHRQVVSFLQSCSTLMPRIKLMGPRSLILNFLARDLLILLTCGRLLIIKQSSM